MGRDVPALVFTREDRRRYRAKMQTDLEVLARMLSESSFESERPRVGLEIELNLVDDRGLPAMRNTDVLQAIADPAWSSELGRFNLEIDIPPRRADDRRPRSLGADDPGRPEPRRGPRRGRRRAPDHGRHPAHPGRGGRQRVRPLR
ncbi:hypothetical protein SVIOM74S_05141 [Streptomyces violarus]